MVIQAFTKMLFDIDMTFVYLLLQLLQIKQPVYLVAPSPSPGATWHSVDVTIKDAVTRFHICLRRWLILMATYLVC